MRFIHKFLSAYADPEPVVFSPGSITSESYYVPEFTSRGNSNIRLGKIILMPLLCCIGFAANSATITAASCSQSNVQSAINSAAVGDTVKVPAGSCTWSSSVSINKGITLLGAGATQTLITSGLGGSSLILMSLSSDVPVRVSGFFFDNVSYNSGGKASIYFGWNMNSSYSVSSLRIDHNKFNKGTKCVFTNGSHIYGVIDHNEFVNCDGAVEADGDTKTWNDPIAAGTSKALFIEDNTFTVNNSAVGWGEQEQIMHGHGNRTVIRYNTFNLAAYSNGSGLAMEAHGNGSCYSGNATDDLRGMPIIEIYNNTISINHSYRGIYIRGGSALIFNNTMTTLSGSLSAIQFAEEESIGGSPNVSNCAKSAWAAEDQINNSFIWNNKLNGAAITRVDLNYQNDPTFIQQGRDYFLHAPEASGGKETYTGRAGGAMTFSASGANAYYPYASYTYPHPLTGGTAAAPPTTSTTINPPTNITATPLPPI